MSAIRIQGLQGCCEGQNFEFSSDVVVRIGRSASCELRLDDASCSRVHATVEFTRDQFVIRDAGSTNGVRVNGKRVVEAAIQYGDRFSLGRNIFVFLSELVASPQKALGDDDSSTDLGNIDWISVDDVDSRLTQSLTDVTSVLSVPALDSLSEQGVQEFERAHLRMQFVYRTSRALNASLDPTMLLQTISAAIFDEFRGVSRVSVFMSDISRPGMLREVKLDTRSGIEPNRVSERLLRRVESERMGILAASDNDGDGGGERKSYMCVPLVVGAKYLGAIYVETDSLNGAFQKSDLELLTVLANQAAAALGNAQLYEELQVSFYDTVRSLSNAIEAKDKYTRGHSDRVARYAVGIGEQMGLDDEAVRTLRVAAELHDIGKIAITEAIIGKSGKLTDEEFALIKQHVDLGVEILRPIRFLQPALPIVRHHHERYNGRGYPDGLKGEEIPLEARILNLADAYDAMTTQRPYNSPMSFIEALNACRKEAGKSFDPDCVDALIRFMEADFDDQATGTVRLSVGVDG